MRKSEMKVINSSVRGTGHVVKRAGIKEHFIHPMIEACGGLFIENDQWSYYNIVTL
jgi:hypothetical protein